VEITGTASATASTHATLILVHDNAFIMKFVFIPHALNANNLVP